MKDFTRKAAIASVIMIFLLLLSGIILARSGISVSSSVTSHRQSFKAACVADLFDRIQTETEGVDVYLQQNLDNNIRLMTDALRSYVQDGRYNGPLLFDDHCVVELKEGQVVLPEGAPGGLEAVTPEMITDGQKLPVAERTAISISSGKNSDEPVGVILSCGKIAGNYYILDWTTKKKIDDYFKKHLNLKDILDITESSFGGTILLVDTSSKDLKLVSPSPDFPDAQTAEEIGITRSMIARKTREFRNKDNKIFECSYKKLDSCPYTVIVLSPAGEGTKAQYILLSFLVTGMIMVICTTMIVWLISIRIFIHEQVLPESFKKRFHPTRIRYLSITAGFMGTVLVFVAASFFHSIGTLRAVSSGNRESLEFLSTRLEQDERLKESESSREEEEWLIYYGEQISSFLSGNPGLATKEHLQSFCDDVEADYIMLFDQNGKETLCSTSYSGFDLGMFSQTDSPDFRLLLKGIPSIVHKAEKSKITGLTCQLIGITLPAGDSSNNNGALIMAFSPERTKRTMKDTDISDLLSILVPRGELCFSIDEKSGKVVCCSDPSLIGLTYAEIGIKKADLRDGFMDFFDIRRVQYYGSSARRKENFIYYYARQTDDMFKTIFSYGLTTIPVFMIIYFILLAYLLKGYDKSHFEEDAVVGKAIANGPIIEVQSDDGRLRKTVDPSRRFVFSYHKWKDLFPEQKAGVVFRSLLLIYMFSGIILAVIIGHKYSDSNILGFILGGTWTQGWNLFAICSVIIVVYIACTIVILSRLILLILCRHMSTRGETICRLLYNCIQYASLFIALYFIFRYLGFDTRAVIASLGLVSLALSLGAKDMVADILAGLSIIFEGDFQVGDIVEIDGYRGMIQEIGVRSTKIIGQGNNIKIVNNRDIKNIVNMTRLNSWYAIDVNIQASESLERVEKILKSELQEIGGQEDMIISGPFYKGVTGIGNGIVTITIIAECKEQNYNAVKSYINRELRLLFSRENIKVQ